MIGIISTGGTILSKAKNSLACHDYKPSDDTLASLLAELKSPYELHELCNIDSSNMSCELLLSLAKSVKELEKKGLKAVIIMHGTDTMEESAFFLDCLDINIPVVFTGAMRPASAVGFEGLKNLFNSFIVANSLSLGDGVFACMNDKVFTAKSLYKANSVNVDAFACANAPQAGVILANKFIKYFDFSKNPCKLDLPKTLAKTGILYSHVGLERSMVEYFVEQEYQAVVVAAYGSGTINEDIMQALQESKLKLLLSTRVPTGGVILNESFKNFVSTNSLSPVKARLLASIILGNELLLEDYFKHF